MFKIACYSKCLVHKLVATAITGLLMAHPAGAGMLINQEPLFLTQSQPPLVMLDMARDHRLYYEAYNDYSDLNGDGNLDLGYKPTQINYYGYFDSFKCYSYNASASPSPRFEPVLLAPNKQCGGAYWSGDFLNYVTMSRMDALRRVLFGGYRSSDTTSLTVLERVYIPQDAHTWGKEYLSIAHDGYDIADYTPLTAPPLGRRHLFANVTLTQNAQTTGDTNPLTLDSTAGNEALNPPLLRVLQNSSLRIWNWVSIERPVAGVNCLFGTTTKSCVTGDTAAAQGWQVVPSSAFTGLSATFYAIPPATSHASNTSQMDALFVSGGYSAVQGTTSMTRIDCDSTESYDVYDDINGTNVTYYSDCNPETPSVRGTADENYATLITGNITVPTAGTYYFAIDGNNAVDLKIDGTLVKGLYGSNTFSSCNNPASADYGNFDTTCNAQVGSIYLTAGTHTIRFRHQEVQVNDGYRLWWKLGNVSVSRQNYHVRVKVCDSSIGLETNCTTYSDGTTTSYKPTGLLHNYGSNNGMYFGLMTGSYKNNTQGGVLRKNISTFTDEFSSTSGIYASGVVGIVGTINKFRITGFRYSDQSYQAGSPSGTCGWITTAAMSNGQCEMWGNPLGEIVYESLRYFSGKTTPTSAFDYSGTTIDANTLGLPKPAWIDPYSTSGSRVPNSVPYCSKPYILAISDSYPSFDSDNVPGSYFNSVSGDLANVSVQPNVQTQGQTMWDNESGLGGTKSVFIGQSAATFDSAPTAKSATSFGTIRGLAPSDPTRQGSYSTAALAYYGRTNDLRSDKAGAQKLGFYSIALAPPLPTIEIPIPSSTNKVTIVPFAKSVGGSSISAASGSFQPTNQIVDFYVDTIKNTDASNADSAINGGRPYYRFRINFEDVEQGADHDMDAIAVYDIWLNADNTISINVLSEYAAGGIMQHIGYVISGTSADGTYLVVRDKDTAAASDPDYFLDTPRANAAGRGAGNPLPLTYPTAVTIGTACVNRTDNFACRTFTASSSSSSAVLLKDPLWYAAKWGGFNDDPGSPNNLPETTEWDADGDGVPDNYFLVVNPLKLEQQMSAALAKIAKDSGTAAALATNSTSLRTNLKLYQARFSSDGWGGEINAYPVLPTGVLDSPVWQAQRVMAGSPNPATRIDPSTRVVLTYDPDLSGTAKGIPFEWSSMTAAGTLQTSLDKAWNASGGSTDSRGSDRVDYLRGSTSIAWARTRPCLSGTSGATCVTNFLGDIVNSAIQYVGVPAFGYPGASYRAFYTARSTRTPMVYVGANDGMLHAFEADTGIERLAYVPSSLYRSSRLSKLTSPDYGATANPHAYYVDGTPTIGDVCRSSDPNDRVCETTGDSSDWKSILVGGLGGGGQGIYALDITDPSAFSEANASSLVMWEFTDRNDADLGMTYSRPAVVRLCTSRDTTSTDSPQPCLAWKWVVIFGNGYNSTDADGYASASGFAHLFVLDAVTGTLLKKLTTTVAASTNGLNSLAPSDIDSDGVVDIVYAGDVSGNMWKFDMSTVSSAAVSYRLYQATTTTGTAQPITTAPEVITHPLGGVMVLFGTGKYIEATDKTNTQQQTIYGIWDKPGSVTNYNDRHNLQQQSLVSDSRTADGAMYSTSTANAVDWATKFGWYLNLTYDGSNPSERVAYDPQVLANVLNLVTIVPSSDVCAYGGDSWDFLLNPLTGARPDYSAFKEVPQITLTSGGQAYASRRKSTVGISPTGTTITISKGEGIVFKGGSTGDVESFGVNLIFGLGRRLSWRELELD